MSWRIEKTIDTGIGGLISFFIGGISKVFGLVFPAKQKRIEKILIVKLWAVGESVLTLPLIKGLRQKYPEAKIDVLCRNANKTIYESHSLVDDVVLFEKDNISRIFSKYKEYDIAIDCEPYLRISALLAFWLSKRRIGFSHTIRNWLYTDTVKFDDAKHEVYAYMDLGRIIGVDYSPERLEKLNWGNYAENNVNELVDFDELKGKKIVGVCATTAISSPHRAWPPEKFAGLVNKLLENPKIRIVFVGTKQDVDLYDRILKQIKSPQNIINLVGKTNLKELFYLVTKCHVFVSNDTGPMHVATAQGVRTIGLFGPNLPLRFAPFGTGNKTVYYQLPCSPCVNVHKGGFPECKQKPKGKCMHMISVDTVYNVINEVLKNARKNKTNIS